jgi:RpiB/LacA/LacB family sugar-phosphate isomerase
VKVALASDHAGFTLKQGLVESLSRAGHEVLDLGTHGPAPVDYPDLALSLGRAVLDGTVERGILVCGSGVGASVAANKLAGIRAAVCHDPYSAHQGVEHDNLNVLCLGARVIGSELARELALGFLHASFSGEERHLRRLAKIAALEQAGPAG